MENKLLKRKLKCVEEENLERTAIASSALGDYYHENESYEQALEQYKEAAIAYKNVGMRMENGIAHRKVGEMYTFLDKFDKALNHEQIYLRTAKEQNNQLEEQRAYATIGRIYLLKGELGNAFNEQPLYSAEHAFLKSLNICKNLKGISKIERMDMEARLYLNLGLTMLYKLDSTQFLSYIEKAIDISKTHHLNELLNQCYTTVANYYFKESDTTKSLRFFNLALKIADTLTNRVQKMCQTLILRSEVFIKIADFQSAKKDLHKAYKLKTSNQDDEKTIEKNLRIVAALCYTQDSLITVSSTDYETRRNLYEKMGDGCCKLENYNKAIEYYLFMLNNAELNNDNDNKLIPIYISLYQTYKDNKQYDLALKYYWKEYELCKTKPRDGFNTLMNIADLYELLKKNYWDMEKIYQNAREAAQQINDKKLEKFAIKKLLELQKKNGLETLAENLIAEASMCGIQMTDEIKEEEEDDEEAVNSEEEQNTPDIGDDICLDDLSDSSSETEELNDRPRKSVRKRGTGFTIKPNTKGETQLHLACISGNITLVRRLLDQGHPTMVRDNAGWLPLHEACNHGNKEIVELLLDKGGMNTINDKGGLNCNGITPLHDSLSNGHLDIAEYLLDFGANPTIRTDTGETALDVLKIWRQKQQLSSEENLFYETIYGRLYEYLEKAGISTSAATTATTSKRLSQSGSKSSSNLNDSLSGDWGREIAATNDDDDDDDVEDRINRSWKKRTPNKNVNLRLDLEYDSDQEYGNQMTRTTNVGNNNENRLNIDNSDSSSQSSINDYTKRVSTEVKRDYQEVMKNLRHRNKAIDDSPIKTNKNTKRSAYLNDNDINDSQWLDNDLAPSKKKRKYYSDTNFPIERRQTTSTVTSNNSTNSLNRSLTPKSDKVSSSLCSGSGRNKTSSTIRDLYDEDDDDDDNNSLDAFEILMNSTSNNSRNNEKSNQLRQRSLSLKKKPQSSLFDAGFSRSLNNSSPIQQSMDSIPDSTVEFLQSTSATKQPNTATQMTSVKVKVENQLLLVPINTNLIDNLTIEWLAEQTSKRYYKLHGVLPELRLMTSDGATFENSDPISIAIDGKNQINSIVLDWQLPPLTQRYMEACTQFKCTADKDLYTMLDSFHINFNLSNQAILSTTIRPILKALSHQTTLTQLNLSNNSISNDGIKYLAQTLPTLKHLNKLDLSGNMITSDGIEILSTIFDKTPICLEELYDINLNFNPLKNQSIKFLSKFCTNLMNLKNLHLCSCEFTYINEDYNLNYQNLQLIDLSFNNLSLKTIQNILRKLNSCLLSHLNFGYTIKIDDDCDNNFINELITFFDSGTGKNLDFLNLSACNITDSNIYDILRSCNKIGNLETLILRQNIKLTSIGFKYLLNNQNIIKNIHLDGCNKLLLNLDIKNLFNLMNNDEYPQQITITLNNNEKLKQIELLKELWEKCWNYKGILNVQGKTVKLFVEN